MHHHTLLHRDADNLSQGKCEKKDGKEQTHVAALSVNEQVLLITCKMKATAAYGSCTIARAVINPGCLASFVNE